MKITENIYYKSSNYFLNIFFLSKILLFTDLHYWDDIVNKSKQWINTHWKTDELLLAFKKEIIKSNPLALINLWDLVTWKTRT